MNAFDVKNKTALVTGANRGIGLAYVESLIQQGAGKVYACARDANALENLDALNATHNTTVVEAVLLDVTSTEDIQALKEKVSTLDLLINNAGVIHGSFFCSDNAVDLTDQQMQTNYYAPLHLIQAFLTPLKQSKGAIVNVCSIAGISSFPGLGPYSVTKAALHSLTQGLRIELSGDGVLVAGVYPGPVDTRMAADYELEKAPPSQIAERTLNALLKGETDIFPDAFSEQMYGLFLNHPGELEKAFAEMH
ncbi:hypothetical protein MNBD_GAMMA10-2915 [hydrothermal vent metagenome]|uniref:Oxidoreductase, short-chain dehydrogenase/reductase family n=1 Tax=hydrothermal vent metagenome TaxID=652676 RepID=A0A3B0XNM9_9ZZZZ